jgi:hypothetical protein
MLIIQIIAIAYTIIAQGSTKGPNFGYNCGGYHDWLIFLLKLILHRKFTIAPRVGVQNLGFKILNPYHVLHFEPNH